jgi:hypothetical protein
MEATIKHRKFLVSRHMELLEKLRTSGDRPAELAAAARGSQRRVAAAERRRARLDRTGWDAEAPRALPEERGQWTWRQGKYVWEGEAENEVELRRAKVLNDCTHENRRRAFWAGSGRKGSLPQLDELAQGFLVRACDGTTSRANAVGGKHTPPWS